MATLTVAKKRAVPIEPRYALVTYQRICRRCGGLMVQDFYTDLLYGTGESDCSIARCVQCGDVVDPVIERNRHLQRTASTLPATQASVLPFTVSPRSSGSTHEVVPVLNEGGASCGV